MAKGETVFDVMDGKPHMRVSCRNRRLVAYELSQLAMHELEGNVNVLRWTFYFFSQIQKNSVRSVKNGNAIFVTGTKAS